MAERPPRRPSTSSLMSETHQRDSARLSNPDVFSDEYAMDSLQISDGFRPSGPNNGAHNREGPQTAPTDHSTEAHVQEHQDPAAASIRSYSSRASTYIERRSSLLSLLSRPDNHRQSSLSGTRASVHSYETPASAVFRSASRASTFTMPRAQSPYQGATGPSHPYGMYVQDTGVLRNPSTATASTVRPQERPYTGSTGPTQPYGMYPQDIVLEDEISPVRSPHRLVPVGFPGRTQNYRRQLGPSGEEADDLVGPDGYTEQLPPYTRWPDGIPPKGGGPGPASILSAERDDPGTSEENLANPFRSRDPLPQHQQSNPSSTNLTAVAASEPQQEDEGGNFKERVIEKGKKKLCFGRVPLWLIAILVIVMVAVLAGVIGAVVGRARGEKQAASTPTIVQRPSWAPAA